MSAATPKPPADGFVSSFPDERFDALLLVSFGGPEGPNDVMPFLENVTRGRDVPRERLEEVAEHYAQFGGVSPINAQNQALAAALATELAAHAIDLPVYVGNRNWHPLLADTLRTMANDGVERALAFFTSAYSSYSSCRQYRENIHVAQREVGVGAPEVLRTRSFFNHPGWIEANADHLADARGRLPAEQRDEAHVAFTAHSIPTAMARHCRYEPQLAEAAALVAERAGVASHAVVFQSRSGPPQVPWLEPDILDHLRSLSSTGTRAVIAHPLGFLSDHMEVVYDLDVEAAAEAARLGLAFERASSASTHPAFVAMIRELVQERLLPGSARRAVGRFGASPDTCPTDCCLPGTGRPSPWAVVGADV